VRDYAKSSPGFWVRGSGRRLRGDHLAQLAAQYLISAPSSNMIGLYYVDLPALAHHIGSPLGGASEALRRACRAGFCAFDQASDLVWVFNVAQIEFGDALKIGDKRIGGIAKLLRQFGQHPFVAAFLHRYGKAFRLSMEGIEPSPLEGPWEPLASPLGGASYQKQDQEQKQEQGILLVPQAETSQEKTKRGRSPEELERARLVKSAFFAGHEQFYGKPPDQWGAPENAHVYHLLKSSSAEVLAEKARAYFGWSNQRAINAGHPFMNHPGSFSANLAEIKADMIAPQRRVLSAQVQDAEKQANKQAARISQAERVAARFGAPHEQATNLDPASRTDQPRALGPRETDRPDGRDVQPELIR
jgi:hypothetical protein